MIAMTLNSNLYLSGLAEIDYMEMNEKLTPFLPSKCEHSAKAGEIFAESARKMVSLTTADALAAT